MPFQASDLVGDKTSKPKWRQVKEIDLYSMRAGPLRGLLGPGEVLILGP